MNIQNKLESIKECLIKIKNDNLQQVNLNIKESTNAKKRVDILKEGRNLFLKFFELGIVANQENISSLKEISTDQIRNLIKDVSNLIVDDKDWIFFYLSAYLDFCVDFYEFDSIGKDVLEIRSGYQFMTDLFRECNENIDSVFKKFYAEIGQDFDKKLIDSKEYGTLEINKEETLTQNIPKNHRWWFWS